MLFSQEKNEENVMSDQAISRSMIIGAFLLGGIAAYIIHFVLKI